MVLLWAALSMAAKDAFGTLLVIAEARGRALTAAILDAVSDLAAVLVVLFGAGQVIAHGWTWHTGLVLAVICTTSFVGTLFWTRLGTRLMPAEAVATVTVTTTKENG